MKQSLQYFTNKKENNNEANTLKNNISVPIARKPSNGDGKEHSNTIVGETPLINNKGHSLPVGLNNNALLNIPEDVFSTTDSLSNKKRKRLDSEGVYYMICFFFKSSFSYSISLFFSLSLSLY